MGHMQPPVCCILVTDAMLCHGSAFLEEALVGGCHSPSNLSCALGIRPTSELCVPRLLIDLHVRLSANEREVALWKHLSAMGKPVRVAAVHAQWLPESLLQKGLLPHLTALRLRRRPGSLPRLHPALSTLSSLGMCIEDEEMHKFTAWVHQLHSLQSLQLANSLSLIHI